MDEGLVRIVGPTEKPRAYADPRGGEAYHVNGSGRRSIGFPVTKGDRRGFLTAGHRGTVGSSITGHDRTAQGTFQGSSFPGDDHAWIATNGDRTATPHVKGAAGVDVTVGGSTRAPVGSSVRRSGSTTGRHRGTIEQHDTCVTYSEGTVRGATRTTVCAEPGDSGGAYVSGDQAQGVTSGGSGNRTTGGTTYHRPVDEILSAYGLTLVTG
ncbi:S1 family peptidase [Streptomyces megasporus]|uniref:S1 family peptidase n=1 Tax=Streptomyces megasporus TaxID=44060 RepID=UPI000690C3A9|nr:S1 family peptidase [Streptomyces megasporus]